MDIYLVNSGPSDFWKPSKPLRNALYKNNRDGTFTDVTEKAGVRGGTFGMGVAVGDYDNDGWPDIFVTAYGNCILYQQQSRRHIHRCHREGRPRDARLDHQRGLVRLRQRRPAGSVRLQLRRLSGVSATLACGDNQIGQQLLLHPALLQAHRQLPLPQQRRRHIYRSQQGHRYRAGARQGPGRGGDRHQQRWLHGPVRRQRHGAELSVRESRSGAPSGRWKWEEIALPAGSRLQRRAASRAPAWAWMPPTSTADGWQDLFVANVDQEMFSLYRNSKDETFRDVAHCQRRGPGDAPAERLGVEVSSTTTTMARWI